MKSYMMPVSMAIGIVFYEYLYHLAVITPYLVSIMLFISYCNISLRDIRICKLHFLLLLIQILGSVGVYSILSLYDRVVAQGVMVCILAPTATSAIVITGILKGNIVSLTTYSLLSNMAVVIIAPVIFAVIGYDNGISFWDSLFNISEKIFLILLLPFVLSMLFRKILPLAYEKLRKKQTISFYLWNTALIIVTAKTVMFIMQQEKGNYQIELIVAVLALVVCISQF